MFDFYHHFLSLKLETSHDCEYDSLEVYNGERKVDSRRIAKLCGSTLPQVLVSQGSTLFLRFHSDFSVNFEGFRLEFTQSGKPVFCSFLCIIFWNIVLGSLWYRDVMSYQPCLFFSIFTGCSRRYTGLSGTITSPNHPNVYPLSVDCTYTIKVPAGKKVSLAFSRFEVEVEEGRNNSFVLDL